MAEEGEVEADVVADDHRVADELEQRWQYRTDARRRSDERVGQAGEERDLGWYGSARVDQGLERSEEVAAPNLDGADLGDLVVGPVAAGRLEIEHAERDIAQRGAQFIERALHAVCRTGPNHHCSYLNTNTRTLSNFTVS